MAKSKKTNRQIKERPVIEAINAAAAESVGENKLTRALGSVDYHTREKGLQILTLWLTRRQNISEGDMLKIWKGVFFCFWHSDKVPVQTELAERLAGIVPQLNQEVALLYFTGFIQIMRREWLMIDRLRLDKFLMLVRCFMRQLFVAFKQDGWDSTAVHPYMQMLQTELLLPPQVKKAVGLALHVADVFLPELLKVAADSAPPHSCLVELLLPFARMLEQLDVDMYLQRVRDSVVDALVSELRHPSEGEPFQFLNVGPLASQLFDLGSQSTVTARNRQALYAASQALERVMKKKAKKDKSIAKATEFNESLPEVDANLQTPGSDMKRKKKATKVQSTTKAAELDGGQPEADGNLHTPVTDIKKKKKKAKKDKSSPGTDATEADESLQPPTALKADKGKVNGAVDEPTTKSNRNAENGEGGLDMNADVTAPGEGTSAKKKRQKKKLSDAGGGHSDGKDAGTAEGNRTDAREGEVGKGGESVGDEMLDWEQSINDWLGNGGSRHMAEKKPTKSAGKKLGVEGESKIGVGGLGVSKKLMKKKKKTALEQVGGDAALTLLGTQLLSESQKRRGEEGQSSKPETNGKLSGNTGSVGRVLRETANGTAPETPTAASRTAKKLVFTSKENGGGLLKEAGKEESHGKAQVRKRKKGVVINLKQNIYFPFGSSPPPADLRTPPAARPKGSILKKRST